MTLKVHWLNLFAKFSVTERTADHVTCFSAWASKFRVSHPVAKNWPPYIENFDFSSLDKNNTHLRIKFHRNPMIRGSDITAIFKMAAVRHHEFSKLAILVTCKLRILSFCFYLPNFAFIIQDAEIKAKKLFSICRWSPC